MKRKHLSIPTGLGTFSVLALFAALAAGSASAVTINAFGNGGFETLGGTPGPAANWVGAAAGYSISNDARTGSNAARLNSPQLNAAVMLQNSVADGGQPTLIAGETATFSFWAKGFAGTTGNVLYSLRFLAAGGGILFTTGNVFFQGEINPNTYTQITYASPLVVPAGAEAAFLEISQGIGPIDGVTLLPGNILIDDIVLSTIPEPSSALLLGLGGLAVLRRRRSA